MQLLLVSEVAAGTQRRACGRTAAPVAEREGCSGGGPAPAEGRGWVRRSACLLWALRLPGALPSPWAPWGDFRREVILPPFSQPRT